MAFIFLLGIFFIFSNMRSPHLAEEVDNGNLKFYRYYGGYWRKQLLNWHVVDHESDTSAVLKAVLTSWELINAPQRIVTGITMVLYAFVYALLLFLIRRGLYDTYCTDAAPGRDD